MIGAAGGPPSGGDVLQIVYPALTVDSSAASTLVSADVSVRRSPAVIRRLHTTFSVRLLAALVALVVLAALAAASAEAKKKPSCAEQVVADWYNDGRVDTIYPLHCYREAIDSLATDLVDYSNAPEEIGRAWAFAKKGKPDPGGKGPVVRPGTGKTPTGKTPTGKTPTDSTRTDTTAVAGTIPDTSGPSAVPVPLIVLGGLAVLLLAAGSAGYLTRRRNGGDGDDGVPPAAL